MNPTTINGMSVVLGLGVGLTASLALAEVLSIAPGTR